MDPLQVLERVNAFYNDAFTQLLTLTLAILGFGAVILPIVWQVIQSRSLRIERQALQASIADGIHEGVTGLSAQVSEQIKGEAEKLSARLKSEVQAMNSRLDEQIAGAKAGVFFLQATTQLDKQQFGLAADDFAYAAYLFLVGGIYVNAQRALGRLTRECLPRLDSSHFEGSGSPDKNIDALLKELESRNANGQFTDSIGSITDGRDQAKKRKQQQPAKPT